MCKSMQFQAGGVGLSDVETSIRLIGFRGCSLFYLYDQRGASIDRCSSRVDQLMHTCATRGETRSESARS